MHSRRRLQLKPPHSPATMASSSSPSASHETNEHTTTNSNAISSVSSQSTAATIEGSVLQQDLIHTISEGSVLQQQNLMKTLSALSQEFSSNKSTENECEQNNNNNNNDDAFTTSTATSSQTSLENYSLRQQLVRTISELFEDSGSELGAATTTSSLESLFNNNNNNASTTAAAPSMPSAIVRNGLMMLDQRKKSERSLFSRQFSGRSLMSLSQIFEDESEAMEIFLQSKDSLLSKDSNNTLLPPRKTSFLSQVTANDEQHLPMHTSFISHTSLSTGSDEMNSGTSLSDFLAKNRALTDAEMAALRTEVKRLAELKQHGSMTAILEKQQKQQRKEPSCQHRAAGGNNFLPRDLLHKQTSSRRMIKRRRPRQQLQQQQRQQQENQTGSWTDVGEEKPWESDDSRSVEEGNQFSELLEKDSQHSMNYDGTAAGRPIQQAHCSGYLDGIQETASTTSDKSEGTCATNSSSKGSSGHGASKGASSHGSSKGNTSSSGHTEPSMALSHLFEGMISETDNNESSSTVCYHENDNSSSISSKSESGSYCSSSSNNKNNSSSKSSDEPSYAGNISVPSYSSTTESTTELAENSSRYNSVNSNSSSSSGSNDRTSMTSNSKNEAEQRQRELELLAAPMLGSCSTHTVNRTIGNTVLSKSSTLNDQFVPKTLYTSPQRQMCSCSTSTDDSPSLSRRHRSIAGLELSGFAPSNEQEPLEFSKRPHSASTKDWAGGLSPMNAASAIKSAKHRSIPTNATYNATPVRSVRRSLTEDKDPALPSSAGSARWQSIISDKNEDYNDQSKRDSMKSVSSGTSTFESSVANITAKRASRGTKTTVSSSKSPAARGMDRSPTFKSNVSLHPTEQEKPFQKSAKKTGPKAPIRALKSPQKTRYRRRSINVTESSLPSPVQNDVMKNPIVNLEERLKKIKKDTAPRKPSHQRERKKKEPVRGTARTISVSSIIMGDTSSVVSGLDSSFLDETSMDSSIDSIATGSRK